MVVELVLSFKDDLAEDGESEFSYTLNAPEGFSVTGGQIFIENTNNSDLKRFAFRVDRDEDGTAKLTILEEVNT